jgi:hypothetical protein
MTSFLQKISLLGHFWQEKNNFTIFRFNLSLIAVQIIILIFKFNNLPPQIPFYFSLPWGESQLASSTNIIYLPIFSILITIINGFWAAMLVKTNPLFSKLLIVFSLIFSFFSLFSVSQIVFLVS